ncbi:hypothetical protein [Caballeronia mineralivorans]|jgi:hypothetical protein|uniref:hypothetical protein n=1 Tax=Caballeronia mineralivorans TaxID=2010198 RepID=UPI002AFE3BB4|nr:hypothetical protein [Caballeronia mineralivorans]
MRSSQWLERILISGKISFRLGELRTLHESWRDAEIDKRAEQIGDTQRQAEYFRARTIGKLIDEFVAVFKSNLSGIMTGALQRCVVLKPWNTNRQNQRQNRTFQLSPEADI